MTTLLTSRVESMRARVRALYRDAHAMPLNPQLLPKAFEELQGALEALQTAEVALRQQHEQQACAHAQMENERLEYKSLFEDAPDAYLVSSLDGTIRKANNAALALFSASAKQLLGRALGLFAPEGERRAFRTELARVATLARRDDWTLRLQRYNGELFSVAATVARVCNGLGRPVALRWQLRDVTQHAPATLPADLSDATRPPPPHLTFVTEALLLLAQATEASALAQMAHLAVPSFADLCIIDRVAADGQVQRLATVAAPPLDTALVAELQRSAPPSSAPLAHAALLRAPAAPAGDEWCAPLLAALAAPAQHETLLRALNPSAALLVPLLQGAAQVGRCIFVRATPERCYSPADALLAELLAHRAALLLGGSAHTARARTVGQ